MKSRFLGYCFHTENLAFFHDAVAEYRREHPEASHFTYAIRWQENDQLHEKFSDDGEPQGSAGKPLLGFLQKKEIMNTSLVVVRYFGGTKLGKKRLLSAYLSAGVDAANQAFFKEKKAGYCVHLTVAYSDYPVFENWLKKQEFVLLGKNFSATIELELWISQQGTENLKAFIAGSCIMLHSIEKMDML